LKKKISVLFAFFLVFPGVVKTQTDDKIIAKIGNISISEKEFKMRYEFTPHLGLQRKRTQETKRSFLYSLIAEKLFALDALNSGLDTNDIVQYTLKEYEKMFVRDALYKIVIKDKAKSKADSLLTKYIDEASEFWMIFIASKDENEINRIYDLLGKGVPFDSLYVELNNNDTLKLKIGDLDEDIETELLGTNENNYTKPMFIKTNSHGTEPAWFIFKMVKKNNPILARLTGWETEYKRLEKIAESRAENKIYRKFMTDFFRTEKIKADGELLKSLAKKISSVFKEKSKNRKSEDEKIFLDIYDLISIQNGFGKDSLNMTYIYLDDNTITLKDFLRHFRFINFSSTKYDFQTIASLVNSKTKKFIEEELLVKEGYKRGLQNLPEVKESYNTWRDNYLFQVDKASISDSVKISDEDILNEYNKSKGYMKPAEVKIIEILTDSLEVVEKVLNGLRNNIDIHELARKYSQHKLTKENGGELGFFPVTSYGEIGKIAGTMKIGEVYGPLKVPEGYSIFKLIGKKEESKIQTSFDDQKEEIKNELTYKKMNDSIINYTVKLANKYGIKIYEDALSSVNVTAINSFVFRYLGFGDRITAVPLLPPNTDWVKQWQESIKIVP